MTAKKQTGIIRESADDAAEETGPPSDGNFRYEHDGHIFTWPSLAKLRRNVGFIRGLGKITDSDAQAFFIIESVATPEDMDAIDGMEVDDLAALIADWKVFSGVGLGESSASGRGPAVTGKR